MVDLAVNSGKPAASFATAAIILGGRLHQLLFPFADEHAGLFDGKSFIIQASYHKAQHQYLRPAT